MSTLQIYRKQRRYRGVLVGIALGIAGLVTVLTMGDSVEADLGYNLELLGSATIVKATWEFDRTHSGGIKGNFTTRMWRTQKRFLE